MPASKGSRPSSSTGANRGLVKQRDCKSMWLSDPELSAYFGLYTVRDATTSSALTSALARSPLGHAHEVQSLELTKLDNIRQAAEEINVSCPARLIPHRPPLMLYLLDFDVIAIRLRRSINSCKARVSTGQIPHPYPDTQCRLRGLRKAEMDRRWD